MSKETREKEQEGQCHKPPRRRPISEMGGGEATKCSVKVCTRALVVELDVLLLSEPQLLWRNSSS